MLNELDSHLRLLHHRHQGRQAVISQTVGESGHQFETGLPHLVGDRGIISLSLSIYSWKGVNLLAF